MCSLHSIKQNDFEREGKEWPVLTRDTKKSHFYNNVAYRDLDS